RDLIVTGVQTCALPILQKGKEGAKVISYSNKLIEVINSKAKPTGVSDADWENRKKTITGLGRFWIDKQYFNDKKYGPADKELREIGRASCRERGKYWGG